MVPDLPMFLRAGPSYWATHAASTAIPVGVPLGLLLMLLIQHGKAPSIALLPRAWRLRLSRHASASWLASPRDLFSVLSALALGILTHIVWDAFTHEGRWG